MKVYKIRNKDGLFSTGTSSPRWTKEGKTWTSLGKLKNHLNLFITEWNGGFLIPEDWEIVEAEVVYNPGDVKNARLEMLEHIKQQLPKLAPYKREKMEKILKKEKYL